MAGDLAAGVDDLADTISAAGPEVHFDRFAGFQSTGTLEDDRRRTRMSLRQELGATPEELVGAVALARLLARFPLFAGMGSHFRYGISSIRSRRGFSVRPGIRPRLAIGLPSISLRSPVKSMGLASLIADPTAKESTGASASLK